MGPSVLLLSFLLLQAPPGLPPSNLLEVAGTVVDSVTGHPLANARVTCAAGGKDLVVLSDASGNFRCPQKPPFHAVATAVKAGYAPGSGLARGKDGGAEQGIRSIRIELRPFAVVEGSVVNEDGEPLPGIRVQLMRGDVRDGLRRWQNHAWHTTDDRGRFRLWRLTPGEYILKAAGRHQNVMSYGESLRFSESEESYGPQYYPRAAVLADAEAIRLEPGATFRADFRLASHRAYAISGRIQGLPGYTAVTMQLLRGKEEMGSRAAVNPATGAFRVSDVPDGTYLLRAYQEYPRPAEGDSTVTVRGGDVTGVQVVLGTGVRVQGTVTYPASYLALMERRRAEVEKLRQARGMSEEQRTALSQSGVTVRMVRLGEVPLPGGQSALIAEAGLDGQFSINGVLPGRYALDTYDLNIVSARAGAADVLNEGLVVSPAGVPRIEMELSAATGTVVVELEDAREATDALVWLVRRTTAATSAHRIRYAGRRIQYAAPPGDYTAYALAAEQELEYRNPAALEALAPWAASVTIVEGRETTVRLKVKP